MEGSGDVALATGAEGDTALNAISSSLLRWRAPHEPGEPPSVLEPEHPLMLKFQQALHQYLLKENDRVNTQIIELKANLKKDKQDYTTQMSQEMYNMEQEVQQQRNTIQQYEDTLESVVRLREEREEAVRRGREKYREKLEKLNLKKREDSELQGELDALKLLCKQYEAWRNETDCDLAVSQRISEKMAVERQEKANRQKELDMMMYKLTTEVWRLESQLALVEEQSEIKHQELEATAAGLADSTADLEALRTEQTRLLQAWASVVGHVQRRDHLYTQLNDEYTEMQSDFQVLTSEIEGVKKEIAAAMQAHEDITVQKDRIHYDLANCQRSVKMEEKKRDILEAATRDTTAALELTDQDLQQANMENNALNCHMKVILRDLEKLTGVKLGLEWEVLEQLQARLCSDKATEATAASIRKLKEESRKLEVNLLSSEAQQASIVLQVERQKEKNQHIAQLADQERELCEEKEREVNGVEENIKEALINIERKQTNLETVNKKMNLLLEQLQGAEKSPAQRKVDELEMELGEARAQVRSLQQDWLRAQGRVVALAQQHHAMASDMSITRKQVQVLEHKNIKLEGEISRLLQEEAAMQRTLAALQGRVEQLFQQRSEDRKHNQQLEAAYNHLTLEYMAQLKDAEEETMNIEEEITELEEEKEQLAIDLHKIRKEAMSWQKMVILAMETKQKMLEEKSTGGEVGKMKLEIHRMQVRQAQLSRLANRLADELAQGVARRELATGRAGDPRRRRLALPSTLRDKRNDIRKVQQDVEVNKSMVDTLVKEEEFLQQQLNERLLAVADVEHHITSLRMQLEEAQLNRQKNLERLIRWQRCGQQWSAITGGRGLPGARGVDPVTELSKQAHQRRSLRTLATNLLASSTEQELKNRLLRVLSTLQLHDGEQSDTEMSKDDEAEEEEQMGGDCRCSS